MNKNMKVIIVGGVAGGASCAARLRRLNETAEIILVERGPYVSYANCGLPYYVGGVIEQESSLFVADERTFREQFAIDVRSHWEATQIFPDQKTIELRQVLTGETVTESYDKLVLSPGAAPIRPNLPGIDLPGIFSVRTVPDVRAIRRWLEASNTLSGLESYSGFQTVVKKRAVVVGGGFIGLEMAENLIHLGLDVTLIQRGDQILEPLDLEMARYVQRFLGEKGLHLVLNDGAAGFQKSEQGQLMVFTQSGQEYPADIVVLGIGVQPEVELAKSAGLEIGQRGGIRVDEQMHTSQPDIFAVGDAVEVKDFITREWSLVALAGPANRQGRIAADVICGRNSRYRGTQGTAIIGLFGAAAGWTGVSEKTLQRLGDKDYEKIYIYPNSHAGYYPGAKMLAIKLIFRKSDGRVIGAQALGQDGVDKRIDAFAMAIQAGFTIYDLEESELTYAPQFGGAKSPVNFAGMVAADVLRDDVSIAHWHNLPESAFLLDVRHPQELAVEQAVGVVNIPLPELRSRLDELPKDREICVVYRSGQRAYYATRILLQNGFQVRNVSGGMMAHSVFLRDETVAGTLY
ncbi:FAD-dependent oxidoreductase [Synechocystis salina]|uniref:FAD-dependent oxidoreductase n=1 Tax=Synechocystis salina TaxID=945780 RepID=UPI001D143C6A|nr:FAD-dependent oxidoreductase [Synechocystis salina]